MTDKEKLFVEFDRQVYDLVISYLEQMSEKFPDGDMGVALAISSLASTLGKLEEAAQVGQVIPVNLEPTIQKCREIGRNSIRSARIKYEKRDKTLQ